MFHTLQHACQGLARHASLTVIATAVVAFLLPSSFLWVQGNVQTIILGIIMLTMGLTLTPEDFRILASRPLDVFIGALAQFTIMPLVAFMLTWAFSQVPIFAPYAQAMAIGIILVGCCPGGVSSNIMSYLCHGDVAYSVGMTCASTLLAPVVTPLLVLWLAGAQIDIDAIGMFKQILIVTILPIAIGYMLNHSLGHRPVFSKLQSLMPALSVICLACIVGGVVSVVHDRMIEHGWMLFGLTFMLVFCHNTIGYVLGYLVGSMLHFSTPKRRTLSIEVGMQNAGLATNLATTFFVATVPMALIPCAISCAYHSISGTILAGLFLKRDH